MSTGGTEQAVDAPVAAPDTAVRLLSPLRAQRFDLLVHLVANLEQPLAVCGPEGCGKTTFLHLLSEQALENWRVIPLDTATRLTAEQAQDAIMTALDGGGPDSRREPETLCAQLACDGQLAVVVFDDAGRLPPLTLAELHRLARRFPVLRLVLALRPEEARARASTNAGLFDDCHCIEVPPLDENGCGDFLRQLAQAQLPLPGLGDITPDSIARVFQDTGGVPGRILRFLAAPYEAKPAIPPARGRFGWLGVLGLSFAMAVFVSAWVWHGRELHEPPPLSEPAVPVVTAPEAPAEPAPPSSDVVGAPLTAVGTDARPEEAPPALATLPQPVAEAQGTGPVAAEPGGPAAEAAISPPAREPEKESGLPPPGAETPAKPPQGKAEAKIGLPAGVSGPEWILAQDSAAWSLQIMSARNPASITALQKRHPGLKGLSAYRVSHQGRALYVVLHGLFRSGKEARHASARLPEALGDAVPRSLGEIQREAAASLKAK
jgi:type II secretory pathway predicted ATPase ExeA